MSNIVVDPDEISEDEVENTEEETLEATEVETEEETPEVPDKFSGKSVEDIIKSYQNLEQELGRKSQEIGELRQLSDSFLQAEISRNGPQTSHDTENSNLETEEDFYDDPSKAVNSLIEKHPKFQEFQQFQAQQAQAGAKARLEQTHPDFTDVVQDKAFQEWVQDSPIRMQMFQAADSYNFDAANELLSNWKDRSMISKTQEVKQAAETNRKDALKAASTESRSSSGSNAGGKTYRRADLIRLKMEDPSRYEALEDDIYAAYADGRVV